MSSQTGVKITVPKAGQLANTFAGFGDKLPNNLRKATGQARKLLVAALSEYPAPPPGSTYDRTEALKRGWQRASPIVGTRFELVNPIEHAGFVQGDPQAWMHVGRWTPASEIAADHEAEIVELYDDATKETIEQ
jgi:hypothetical protein